jgi:hypothetical protein
LFIKQKSRGGADGRARLSRLLPLLPVIVLLIPVQSLDAAALVSSGTVQVGNTITYGTTSYSVDYSLPTTAEVGTNLTIALSLHVNSLSGIIDYITDYRFDVYAYIGAQQIGSGSVVSSIDAPYLYPGGVWANNVTIPLTASGTGLAEGQSANATVSFTLENQVYIANGRDSFYTSEPPMQGQVGGILIQYGTSSASTSTTSSASTASRGIGQSYLTDALLASGAVLVILAVALWPRSPAASGIRAKAT